MSSLSSHSLLSLEEERRVLGGIGRTKFYSLVASNDIRIVKIGRRSFVIDTELGAFIEKLRDRRADGDAHVAQPGEAVTTASERSNPPRRF